MARILLLLHHAFGLPTLDGLRSAGHLSGVVVPDGSACGAAAEARRRAERAGIPSWSVRREELGRSLPDIARAAGADAGLVTAFPWRLPPSVLGAFPSGIFNVHPGALPEYRGADPIFWQIRRGASAGGVTVHRVDAGLDTGPVFAEVAAPLVPWETHGIHAARLGGLAEPLALRLAAALDGGTPIPATPQRSGPTWPCRRPRPEDLAVRWLEDDAPSIQRLVNACNGAYDGPVTALAGEAWKLAVVTVMPAADGAVPPGTVVLADPAGGLLVACRGGTRLRLDVVATREGTLTGAHLVALGLASGARFDPLPPTVPTQA